MHEKNSHCSYCGAAFERDQPWPRTCANCGNISYLNPLPVAVVLVPTDRGVVLIRRGVEPERTKWALPGGYIHAEETWRQAGAREVMEETGIEVDPSAIEDFCVRSAPDGTLLVFGVAGAVRAEDLPAFEPGPEALERTVVSTPPPDMAFALHREALESYLEGRKPQHG